MSAPSAIVCGPRAAAVIIRRGPRILGFVREKDGQTGIPCGWIDEGETPQAAAVRECYEETGFRVALTPAAPYVGFDPRGGIVVATFLGEVIEEGQPTHTHEGSVVWVGVREILASGYGDYNRRAFAHFGIAKPLAGKFHSHMTIACSERDAERARSLVGGKLTVIALERGARSGVDVMVTHHFVVGNRGLDDHHDVLNSLASKARMLEDSGIRVIRIKLEHEFLDSASLDCDIQGSVAMSAYVEAHVKCRVELAKLNGLKGTAEAMGWHPSRNPRHQTEDSAVQFVNRRFYGAGSLAPIESEVSALVATIASICQVVEVKMESAIYDSNEAHDSWWSDAR